MQFVCSGGRGESGLCGITMVTKQAHIIPHSKLVVAKGKVPHALLPPGDQIEALPSPVSSQGTSNALDLHWLWIDVFKKSL